MENYNETKISDREINISPNVVLSCKINPDGIIEYVNRVFSDISGYEEFEIIGEPLDKMRHPDMPKIIFEFLKDRLKKQEKSTLISKYLARDGRFFWIKSEFETQIDSEGNSVAHYSHSTPISTLAISKISSLYKILSKIEAKTGTTKTSERYLIGFLEERNKTYNEYIEELCQLDNIEHNPITQSQTLFQQRKTAQNPLQGTVNTSEFKSKTTTKKRSLFQRIFGRG